jgi:hypothetical protein
MQYNRGNEIVQQYNTRESTYKIVVDNPKKCVYSRVMVTYKGFKMIKLLQGFTLGLLCFTIPLTVYVLSTGGF